MLLIIQLRLLPDIEINARDFDIQESRRTVEYRMPELPNWFTRRFFSVVGAIFSIFGILLTLLWVRVLLETAIVIFNIATSVSSIDQKTEDSN